MDAASHVHPGDERVITVDALTKRFGSKVALDGVTFRVEPGRVTGFLGPNGSGKTTTMRILLGLERPTAGTALVDGVRYATLPDPMRRVGALLDASNAHPGRSAFHHLRALALTHGIPDSRVDDVLLDVGLADVATGRIGGFSLGMRQRLGIAGAMLGDPGILVFDEPVNGLDPDGVLWFRDLVRGFAAEGRTVFLSSHLISELALTADHVIVLGRGRVLADAPIEELGALAQASRVLVRTPEPDRLARLLASTGGTVTVAGDVITVDGMTAAMVGDLAVAISAPVHELRLETASLEDAYRALTDDAVEYRTGVR